MEEQNKAPESLFTHSLLTAQNQNGNAQPQHKQEPEQPPMMAAGTFGGDIGVIGQYKDDQLYKDEGRMSVTDNSANSIYGKGVAPGPDG